MKQPQLTKLFLACALTAAAAAAHAKTDADAAEIQAQAYLEPGACVADLSNATVDFGQVTMGSLNSGAPTKLNGGAVKSVSLTVQCAAPRQVAFTAKDMGDPADQPFTGGDITQSGARKASYFGLGKQATSNDPIGAFSIRLLAGGTVDGTPAQTQSSDDQGQNWGAGANYYLAAAGSRWGSLATTGNTPAVGSTFVFPLAVAAAVVPKTTLDTSIEAQLDGNAQIDLMYW